MQDLSPAENRTVLPPQGGSSGPASVARNPLDFTFATLGKKIGILGGSFDPVHEGHLTLARNAKDRLGLDAVVFIPTPRNPLKDAPQATSAQRLEMLCAAVYGEAGFFVSDIELARNGAGATVHTLREIRAAAPQAELFFLIGSDILPHLPRWNSFAEIFSLATVVTGFRPGFALGDFGAGGAFTAEQLRHLKEHLIEMPPVDLSSTEIRAAQKSGVLPPRGVPAAVVKIILFNHLYQQRHV